MHIQHIRNATSLLHLGHHRILLDPMMSPAGAMPGFKMFGGGRRNNPLVPLPQDAPSIFEQATCVLVTHEHPDHLDQLAIQWIADRQLPVYASSLDAPNLRAKGLTVHTVTSHLDDIPAQVVPAQHGPGLIGWLLGPVSGFYLAPEDAPSVYITADTILNDTIRDAVKTLNPDIIIAPAGSANFGIGKDIIFSVDQLVELTQLSNAQMVFTHLESLDHCPTTREGLLQRMRQEGLHQRVHIPNDGQSLSIEVTPHNTTSPQRAYTPKPGFQKWLTSKMAGTTAV